MDASQSERENKTCLLFRDKEMYAKLINRIIVVVKMKNIFC